MDQIFDIDGYKVSVHFEKHIVRLKANDALRSIIKFENGMQKLSQYIHVCYINIFDQELLVTHASLKTEIEGHVYAYRLLVFVRKVVDAKLFRQLSYHVCKIDCGEKHYDGNRWIWDLISKLYK